MSSFFIYQCLFQLGTDSSVNKLTVISQRENVLNAIGALSRSPSTNISQEEILKLFEKYFYSMIQQEVHEGLICHMLQQMTQWCSRLTTVNQTLTDFFKVIRFIIGKVLLMLLTLVHCVERTRTKDKHSDYTNCIPSMYVSSIQRYDLHYNYFNDLGVCYVLEDTLASLIPLHSTLMASYERGLNQPTLIICLQEALLAALLMVNIAQMNSSYGTRSALNQDVSYNHLIY